MSKKTGWKKNKTILVQILLYDTYIDPRKYTGTLTYINSSQSPNSRHSQKTVCSPQPLLVSHPSTMFENAYRFKYINNRETYRISFHKYFTKVGNDGNMKKKIMKKEIF